MNDELDKIASKYDGSVLKFAADTFELNSLKSSSIKADAFDAYKSPLSDIPLEEIEKYKYIYRQENYWKNKHNDLAEAICLLTAYNIDIDYSEVVLRMKEAARFRDEFTMAAAVFEKQYPYIEQSRNYVYNTDEVNHDPITNRMTRTLENNRLKNAGIYYGLAGQPKQVGFATSSKSINFCQNKNYSK